MNAQTSCATKFPWYEHPFGLISWLDMEKFSAEPPLKVALMALAALAILWTVCYIWRRNTSVDYEWHSEMIVRPDPPSK